MRMCAYSIELRSIAPLICSQQKRECGRIHNLLDCTQYWCEPYRLLKRVIFFASVFSLRLRLQLLGLRIGYRHWSRFTAALLHVPDLVRVLSIFLPGFEVGLGVQVGMDLSHALSVVFHEAIHDCEVHGLGLEAPCELASHPVHCIQTHVDPFEQPGLQWLILVTCLGKLICCRISCLSSSSSKRVVVLIRWCIVLLPMTANQKGVGSVWDLHLSVQVQRHGCRDWEDTHYDDVKL